MQPHASDQTPFEVHCNHCRVTFPVGTKRCIHCGERLARQRFHPDHVMTADQAEELLVETEMPQRSRRFSPVTLMWIAVLVGGSLMRLCSEQ